MEVANVSLSIMSDGDRTVVEASYHPGSYDTPVIRAAASSSRQPGDKTDRTVGEALAVQRALEKIARKLAKQANGRMKHKEEIARHAAEIAAAKKKPQEGPAHGLGCGCGCGCYRYEPHPMQATCYRERTEPLSYPD